MEDSELRDLLSSFWTRFGEAYRVNTPATEAWESAVSGLLSEELTSALLEAGQTWGHGKTLQEALSQQSHLISPTIAYLADVGQQVRELSKMARRLGEGIGNGALPVRPRTPESLPSSDDQQLHFLRELSFLVDAGAPLVRCLRLIRGDLGDCEITSIIDGLVQDIEGGSCLSETMNARGGGTFGPVIVNLIRAGEAGGVLDVVLQRLVDAAENGTLDLSHSDVLDASGTTDEQVIAERARLWKLMSLLISSGVPILEVFGMLGDCVRLQSLREWLKEVRETVRNGGGLSESMSARGAEFSPFEIELVNRGEEEGNLDRLLDGLGNTLANLSPEQLAGQERPREEEESWTTAVPFNAKLGDEEPERLADKAPVVKLLNLILQQAIKDNATDIHLQPYEDMFVIRYRVDGKLYEMMPPPKHLALALLSRIKIMAGLDIAERRLPQDGRLELNVSGEKIDLRVSTAPTVTGEHCMIRILRRDQALITLDRLGLSEGHVNILRAWSHSPNGVVIVSGPAGSGKTTALYSCVNEINRPDRCIVSVEDPVEYRISGIAQIETKPRIGLDMPRAIRTALRQGPDVLMLTLISKGDVATAACEAALQGHLVLSGMTANDAILAVGRMVELSGDPMPVAGALRGVSCQRLVRKLCDCKREVGVGELSEGEREAVADLGKEKFFVPQGCGKCHSVGYKGRTGIFQFLEMTGELREGIAERVSHGALREIAEGQGFKSIRADGLARAAAGDTSVEEVLRVTE